MQNEHIQDNSSFFSFTGAALKQILSKQKMLYSFLASFALLVENVRNIDDKEFNVNLNPPQIPSPTHNSTYMNWL